MGKKGFCRITGAHKTPQENEEHHLFKFLREFGLPQDLGDIVLGFMGARKNATYGICTSCRRVHRYSRKCKNCRGCGGGVTTSCCGAPACLCSTWLWTCDTCQDIFHCDCVQQKYGRDCPKCEKLHEPDIFSSGLRFNYRIDPHPTRIPATNKVPAEWKEPARRQTLPKSADRKMMMLKRNVRGRGLP